MRYLLVALLLAGCVTTVPRSADTDTYNRCRYQAYMGVPPTNGVRSGADYRQINNLIDMCLRAEGY